MSDEEGRSEGASTSPRHPLAPIAWYTAVAGFNAAFYVLLCELLSAIGLVPSQAATTALLPVLVVSYLGHKTKTFQSHGMHRTEAPRFAAMCVLDLALAGAAPYAAGRFHIDATWSFVVLTALIPLANVALMRFWIFRAQ